MNGLKRGKQLAPAFLDRRGDIGRRSDTVGGVEGGSGILADGVESGWVNGHDRGLALRHEWLGPPDSDLVRLRLPVFVPVTLWARLDHLSR